MSDRKEDNKSDVQHLDYNNQTSDSASSFVYEEGTEAERRLLRKIDIVSGPVYHTPAVVFFWSGPPGREGGL